MIGYLEGVVRPRDENSIIVVANGVGYLVNVSSRTVKQFASGAKAELEIETRVRESDISLFGFVSEQERIWFTRLTGVQGIGGKVALSLLSCFETEELEIVIAQGDEVALCKADGVGKRVAQRLVTELKKFVDITKSKNILRDYPEAMPSVNALTGLGFDPKTAKDTVSGILTDHPEGMDKSEIIKLALVRIGNKK